MAGLKESRHVHLDFPTEKLEVAVEISPYSPPRLDLFDLGLDDSDRSPRRYFYFGLTFIGELPPCWSLYDRPYFSTPYLVNPSATLGQLARKISHWLDACSSLHSKCETGILDILPDRVLDVTDYTYVRLHTSHGQRDRYSALSYCWGNKGQYTLTKTNMDQISQGVLVTCLPQTVQDAINLARELGLSFVWIDALCIIQDDPSDWDLQSSKMASIYENASVTFFASKAFSVHEGFLGLRPTNGAIYGEVEYKGYKKQLYLSPESSKILDLGHAIEREPLHSCGWALQENLLSRRKVFFCTHQMFWQCKCAAQCESGLERNPVQAINHLGLDTDSFVYETWLRTIETYSTCTLTKPSDRLPTISGLVSRFATIFRSTYLAGHWSSHLPFSLLWLQDYDADEQKGLEKCSFPSWSWISLGDSICHQFPSNKGLTAVGIINDYRLTLSGKDSFGAVKKAFIYLKASVILNIATLHELSYNIMISNGSWTSVGESHSSSLNKDVYLPHIRNVYLDRDYLDKADAKVSFVLLCTNIRERYHGVVVVAAGSVESDRAFRRVGMFTDGAPGIAKHAKLLNIWLV